METATINLTALKAVACAAGAEQYRYYLNGVYLQVEPAHVTYVATDGHILLAHREFMEGENTHNTLVGNWIIPTEICNGKVDKGFPLDCLQKTQDGKLLLSVSGRIFAPVDGVFPDWQRVVPHDLNGKTSQYDPALLMRLQKAASLLLNSKKALTNISHNGDGPGLTAWAGLSNTVGVIMPSREGLEHYLPDWLGPERLIPEHLIPEELAAE